jgi:hypothetical protein
MLMANTVKAAKLRRGMRSEARGQIAEVGG